MKLYLESLGCARNLVDSETMIGRLVQAHIAITQTPSEADIIVVNTCSFIESATQESIDTILTLAEYKVKGICKHLIVAGCLPERFREELAKSLPEVDHFLGTGAYDQIVNVVRNKAEVSKCILPDPDFINTKQNASQRLPMKGAFAYLKIAEGCSKHCTYCIIPKLRGRHKSYASKRLVSEAVGLVKAGKKEIDLIAQDTTAYGKELTPPIGLNYLLSQIAKAVNNVWVRILYGHPESIELDIIETMKRYQNICSYIDIPIQHASNKVLKQMGRKYTSDTLYELFENFRSILPDIALRTTVIVGFPGETDKDFDELLGFIKKVSFNHLGAFTYSDSDDLPSHHLKEHVSKSVAKQRYDQIMKCQAEISLRKNQEQIGRLLDVLVESKSDENIFEGRTQFQAPEVDGVTYIKGHHLKLNQFMKVKIIDADEYDLIGEVI